MLTLVAYVPVFNAGFIWDDDAYVTENKTLRDRAGLKRIWLSRQPIRNTIRWSHHLLGRIPLWGVHRRLSPGQCALARGQRGAAVAVAAASGRAGRVPGGGPVRRPSGDGRIGGLGHRT